VLRKKRKKKYSTTFLPNLQPVKAAEKKFPQKRLRKRNSPESNQSLMLTEQLKQNETTF